MASRHGRGALSATRLQSLMTSTGYLNPYTLSLRSTFRMPASGQVENPFKKLVQLTQKSIRPSTGIDTRDKYKGIVLAVEDPNSWNPVAESNNPLVSWYKAKYGDKKAKSMPKFYKFHVRIPELHTAIPCPPTLVTNLDIRHRQGSTRDAVSRILLHPAFYLERDAKSIPQAGGLVEVDFFNNEDQMGGGRILKQLYFNEGGLQGCSVTPSPRLVFPCHGKLTCGPGAPEKQKEDIRKKIQEIRALEEEILSRKKTECDMNAPSLEPYGPGDFNPASPSRIA